VSSHVKTPQENDQRHAVHSIMMEAARLIEAAGLKPRRTIRVALWSGEE
jgi:Zn-dependent M28 family amino/carboxypeptidase